MDTLAHRHEFQIDAGTVVTIRPIEPKEAEIEQRFVRLLSPQSKRFRFLGAIRELTPAMLKKFTSNDNGNEIALIATVMENGAEKEIGVARFAPGQEEGSVELAVVVGDEWAGHGIGSELLRCLFDIARKAGLRVIYGTVLSENHRMIQLARDFGFEVEFFPGDARLVRIRKEISPVPVPP